MTRITSLILCARSAHGRARVLQVFAHFPLIYCSLSLSLLCTRIYSNCERTTVEGTFSHNFIPNTNAMMMMLLLPVSVQKA